MSSLVMQKILPASEVFEQGVRRWRNVRRVGQRAAWTADPILAPAEFSGRSVVAANSSHQLFVQFAHQTERYVIVHEMVHLLAPTHSERFVALLTKNYPSWREARSELNELPLAAVAWRE